ncbi:hypothetical protein C8J56DRAFT_796804 [Mycena floridula]|nr:hypothetical protein C8J56DRAFT_796804 [Mycena floridula]
MVHKSENTDNIDAVVTVPGAHKLPLVSGCRFTPELTKTLFNAFDDYFIAKKTATTDMTSQIFGCFQDPIVRDWFDVHKAEILELTMPEFQLKFKGQFLETDWEDDLRRSMMTSKQKEEVAFKDWVIQIQKMNSLLKGTDSFLDDDALMNLLEANMLADLQEEIRESKPSKTSLKKWLEIVAQDDQKVRRFNKKVDSALRKHDQGTSTSNAQQSYPNRKPYNGNSTAPNKSQTKAPNSTTSTTSSSSSSRVRAQPLSAAYKQFLKDNEGCYKC